jgi:hypothetical protein
VSVIICSAVKTRAATNSSIFWHHATQQRCKIYADVQSFWSTIDWLSTTKANHQFFFHQICFFSIRGLPARGGLSSPPCQDVNSSKHINVAINYWAFQGHVLPKLIRRAAFKCDAPLNCFFVGPLKWLFCLQPWLQRAIRGLRQRTRLRLHAPNLANCTRAASNLDRNLDVDN